VTRRVAPIAVSREGRSTRHSGTPAVIGNRSAGSRRATHRVGIEGQHNTLSFVLSGCGSWTRRTSDRSALPSGYKHLHFSRFNLKEVAAIDRRPLHGISCTPPCRPRTLAAVIRDSCRIDEPWRSVHLQPARSRRIARPNRRRAVRCQQCSQRTNRQRRAFDAFYARNEYACLAGGGRRLLCLAAALLRRRMRHGDRLIRDKIGAGDGKSHSRALGIDLGNASNWALMLTGACGMTRPAQTR